MSVKEQKSSSYVVKYSFHLPMKGEEQRLQEDDYKALVEIIRKDFGTLRVSQIFCLANCDKKFDWTVTARK